MFPVPGFTFSRDDDYFSRHYSDARDQRQLQQPGNKMHGVISEQESEENNRIIEDTKAGRIKILYIAPERQENSSWIEATRQMNLSMVVVDEAHCISVWGHDFQPAFRRIINLVRLLPRNLPVLANNSYRHQKSGRRYCSANGWKPYTDKG
ncbi:MAG: hypothetical protein MZV64_50420 [Ignavibacteriales bacterium]|nr:hypothetical protein [Ignavibacteriales bacterium]